MIIPDKIGRSRLIKLSDGSVALSKRDSEAEKWLDTNMIRSKNQLIWTPKCVLDKPVKELILDTPTAYIVGKGTSLSNVTELHFVEKFAPVICVNESIHLIEKLNLTNPTFVIVQDKGIAINCIPKKSKIIASQSLAYLLPEVLKYSFDPHEWLQEYNYTPIIAINICKSKGIKDFKMIAFDSITTGDKKYAPEIGYQSPNVNDKDRYKTNKIGIERALHGCQVEWITPSCATAYDTPQQETNIPSEAT